MESAPETKESTGFFQSQKSKVLVAVAVGLLVVSIGIAWWAVRAAGFFSSVEPDAGTVATNAKIVADSSASGGKAVQFTAPVVTAPTPGTGGVVFGMSAPADKWDERLAQVGGSKYIKYRRIFYQSFTDGLNLVQRAISDGMTPVISWKTGSYSWAQVGSGAADADLRALVTKLNAIPGRKILAIHHEPNGDGSASDYAKMQLHALPILKTANNVEVGPIANGWWWTSSNRKFSDAQLAEWIPASLVALSDFIAADTYQEENLNESGGPKATNFGKWGHRVGAKKLGIGEFNGFNAQGITDVMNAVKADDIFEWACVWNAGPTGLGIPLEGDRLEAFKTGLATTNRT